MRATRLDPSALRVFERHETQAHALAGREMHDLGDALLLVDPQDPDPFWNRMLSLRWPSDPAAFDRRLTAALATFAALGRQPHIWPSPGGQDEPPDLVARLLADGFRDTGGGHLMLLTDPDAAPPVAPNELPPGVTLGRIDGRDRGAAEAVADAAGVLVEAFDAIPGFEHELAGDLARALDDPRIAVVLVRVDGAPAAVTKATTFDGLTYLSSIGTATAFRGRGLAALATRAAIDAGRRAGGQRAYLGVFSENHTALRLYERLGFASLGEAPDLLLG